MPYADGTQGLAVKHSDNQQLGSARYRAPRKINKALDSDVISFMIG